MPIVRPARHLSTLWVVGLAFAAMALALSGGWPGWGSRSGATRLADSHFVPDDAVLPPVPHAPFIADASAPAEADPAEAGETAGAAPRMHWNGRSDRVWPLADGRQFVVSPWGATWWQAGAQRLRTDLDLPGLDPALGVRHLADDRLLIPRPEGGAWLLDLRSAQPQLHTLGAEEAAAL